jgi:hypothetical protein
MPSAIESFIARQRSTAELKSRLIFALDATASRQPTWDQACELQASMFAAAGNIEVQLVFYRGDECRASKWLDSRSLAAAMRRITCIGGYTQIGKVLHHALNKGEKDRRIKGAAFVGDSVEEDPCGLYELAGMLGARKVPMFLFQEGRDDTVRIIFAEIARLSGGASHQFDAGSAQQLEALLRAIGSYAVLAAKGDPAKALAETKAALARLASPAR